MTDSAPAIHAAAAAIRGASALLITAGAGMGVDSGLPDFRGPRLSDRTDAAHAAYTRWHHRLAPKTLCIIECGAGTAIPTVRLESEHIARQCKGTLIRINVRDPAVPNGQISIPLPAAEALPLISSATIREKSGD